MTGISPIASIIGSRKQHFARWHWIAPPTVFSDFEWLEEGRSDVSRFELAFV